MKHSRIELDDKSHSKLLELQFDRKKQKHDVISLNGIAQQLIKAVLADENLLKQVLEKIEQKESASK